MFIILQIEYNGLERIFKIWESTFLQLETSDLALLIIDGIFLIFFFIWLTVINKEYI